MARTGGPLHVRLAEADGARPGPGAELHARLRLPENAVHDLVLDIGTEASDDPLHARDQWDATERWWKKAVPDCADTTAPRDTRMAYAVLHGLTSATGGMVAAATTSLRRACRHGP